MHVQWLPRALACVVCLLASSAVLASDLVVLKDGRTLSGNLIAMSKDALTLAQHESPIEITREDVASVHFDTTEADWLRSQLRPADATRQDTRTVIPIGAKHVSGISAISVRTAAIQRVELEGTWGEGDQSDDEHLCVLLDIENLDDRRVIEAPGSALGTVRDDVGNRVRSIRFSYDSIAGQLDGDETILPGTKRSHMLVFDKPLPNTEHLDLEIDARRAGGAGSVVYRIPIGDLAEQTISPGGEEVTARALGERVVTSSTAITLRSASIRKPMIRDPYRKYGRYPESELLCLEILIENLDDRLQIEPNLGTLAVRTTATDDAGNPIRQTRLKGSGRFDGTLRYDQRIDPGAAVTHLFVFEEPLPDTQFVRLRIPVKSLGGDGTILFKIPMDQIPRRTILDSLGDAP